MTFTNLITNKGEEFAHSGTGGLTLTSTREGASVSVQMEFDFLTKEETIAALGMLLVQLDELHGENLVAQCLNHYALSTNKPRFKRDEGQADLVLIRGRRDRRGKKQ